MTKFFILSCKKKKGSIENILYSLICITLCFIIMTVGISYVETLKDYLDANQIARKYVLKMETAGYLNPAASNELIQEMSREGFLFTSIAGSTVNKVNFGEDIFLQITYQQRINSFSISGFDLNKNSEYIPIRITRSSTAKG